MKSFTTILTASAFALSLTSAALACEFHKTAEHDMSKIDTAVLEEQLKKADEQLQSMKEDVQKAEMNEVTASDKLAKIDQENLTDKN